MKAGDCGDNNRRSEPKHQEDLWRLRGFCLMDDDFFTKGAGHQRARFNSSMMDVNLLPKGDDFKDLPETWVKFFKESKERIAIMCKVMEDMKNEAAKEKAMAVAKRMVADGILTLEKIAEYVGLSLDEVKKLKAGQNA